MPKRKPLEREIRDRTNFKGNFCYNGCAFKQFDFCYLFDIRLIYNDKEDKSKRCSKCLHYFKEEK